MTCFMQIMRFGLADLLPPARCVPPLQAHRSGHVSFCGWPYETLRLRSTRIPAARSSRARGTSDPSQPVLARAAWAPLAVPAAGLPLVVAARGAVTGAIAPLT